MAAFTYDQFRIVLKRLDFHKIRSREHETWRKLLPNGTILRTRISHKHKKDIPNWLFSEMLRQVGIDKAKFIKILEPKK